MWNMLVASGSIIDLEFKVIEVEGQMVKTNWIATYIFSETGRKVVNNVIATMLLDNEGKIINQTDEYDICEWARQAFSFSKSILICASPEQTIQKQSAQNLANFIKANPQYQ